MNPNTGEIFSGEQMKEMHEALSKDEFLKQTKDFIPVDKNDMTKRQLSEMQVSMKDNRSKLGKKRIEVMSSINNKKRKAKKRAAKKSRKKNR